MLITDILEKIANARDTGRTTAKFFPLSKLGPVTPDEIAVSAGFTPLGADWKLLSREEARLHLQNILCRDMSYNEEIMTLENAALLTDLLFKVLPINTVFYTNLKIYSRTSRSWLPVTDSTFDTGLIAISDLGASLIWFEDED